jgi:hypothetical protein
MDDDHVDNGSSSAPVPRRWLATTLVVIASVLAFAAILAVWVDRQFLNTDNWADTSSKMLEDPTIRKQVATFLVDELYANVDVEADIQAALPDRLKPLAGPAAGALRTQVLNFTDDVLARPRLQSRWEEANRTAHEQLVRLLEGGGPVLSTSGGAVVLDLKALLRELDQQVGVGGRAASALPADAATITILRSDELSLAQDGFELLDALPIVLVALSLGLFGVALAVSPGWRRRAVRAYGIGLVVAGAGALAVSAVAEDAVVDSLSGTAAVEPAVRRAWGISTTLLGEAATATIGYGVVMIFGAWLAGPTSWAVATRRTAAPYLREPAIAYGALAVVLAAVVLWWQPTRATRDPLLATLLVILVALGWEGLRRRTAREFPGADRHVSMRRARERLGRTFGSARQSATGGAAAVVRQAGAYGTAAAADVRRRTAGAQPASSSDERLEQLQHLVALRDAGILDEDELRTEKARILAAP